MWVNAACQCLLSACSVRQCLAFELAQSYPDAKRARQYLTYPAATGGTVFIFSFGVVVFLDMGQAGREGELLRLRKAPNGVRDAQVITEEFTVREVDVCRAARWRRWV